MEIKFCLQGEEETEMVVKPEVVETADEKERRERKEACKRAQDRFRFVP